MTGISDLATWLRTQLDGDERIARHAAVEPVQLQLPRGTSFGQHIVIHGPERVLAEVNAKRRILDLHHPEHLGAFVDLWCQQCKREEDPCSTLRLLALPYADRPGYRRAWAPDAST